MKTFLSWLIANLEIASILILLPFLWLFIQNHQLFDNELESWKLLLLGSLVIVFLGGNPTKSIFGDLLNIILTIVGSFILLGMVETDSGVTSINPLITMGVSGIVVGIASAVFAVSNFYELVSMRWIYSNSNATKFEISATYGFSRFALGFHLGVFAAGLLL